MKQISAAFLMFLCIVAFSNSSFGKPLESKGEISKRKPFEILYFEELPKMALQELDSQPTDNSSKTSHWAWSFEAFGKQFDLSLDPNTYNGWENLDKMLG